MTNPTFPTSRFGFTQKQVDIERQTLSGGTSLTGDEDTIATDGGGRVFAEFGGGPLVDRNVNLAWRAALTLLEDGIFPMVVPFCDPRHTPSAARRDVPHSDGSPFSDDTLYAPGGGAQVVNAVGLRATTLQLAFDLPLPIIGGEWFSINHATKGWRAYRVATIDGGTVTFRPPLREAVDAGTVVEFVSPRCLMVQNGAASSRVDYGRLGEAAIRFVEKS